MAKKRPKRTREVTGRPGPDGDRAVKKVRHVTAREGRARVEAAWMALAERWSYRYTPQSAVLKDADGNILPRDVPKSARNALFEFCGDAVVDSVEHGRLDTDIEMDSAAARSEERGKPLDPNNFSQAFSLWKTGTANRENDAPVDVTEDGYLDVPFTGGRAEVGFFSPRENAPGRVRIDVRLFDSNGQELQITPVTERPVSAGAATPPAPKGMSDARYRKSIADHLHTSARDLSALGREEDARLIRGIARRLMRTHPILVAVVLVLVVAVGARALPPAIRWIVKQVKTYILHSETPDNSLPSRLQVPAQVTSGPFDLAWTSPTTLVITVREAAEVARRFRAANPQPHPEVRIVWEWRVRFAHIAQPIFKRTENPQLRIVADRPGTTIKEYGCEPRWVRTMYGATNSTAPPSQEWIDRRDLLVLSDARTYDRPQGKWDE